jgi:hypothetical protein
MKTFATSLAVSLVVIAAATATALAGPPPGEGWQSLFNGKDLSGWKVPQGDGGHWKVLDGVIDYDAQSEATGDKNLWTEESFANFTLQVDWKIKRTTGLYDMPTVLPDGTLKTDADGNVIKTPRPTPTPGSFCGASAEPRSTSGAGRSAPARSTATATTRSNRPKSAPGSPPRSAPTNRWASGTPSSSP